MPKLRSKDGQGGRIMIRVEHIDTWGFANAIRGMRNPMNSWEKIDSSWDGFGDAEGYSIGPNDLNLMQRLYKAGPEHRKYMRQIFVSMDITAPLYWWKEYDTYKVGTTANSCSTMHKITAKPFAVSDFSCEYLVSANMELLEQTIKKLNEARNEFVNYDGSQFRIDNDMQIVDKKVIWWQIIQLLPSSYNQKRTVTMTYENAVNMIKQRTGHKLDEWNEFVEVLKNLPYMKEIMEVA